jgi:hypothetical protein
MTWLWIALFVVACVVPMVAWVWFVEHRGTSDRMED